VLALLALLPLLTALIRTRRLLLLLAGLLPAALLLPALLLATLLLLTALLLATLLLLTALARALIWILVLIHLVSFLRVHPKLRSGAPRPAKESTRRNDPSFPRASPANFRNRLPHDLVSFAWKRLDENKQGANIMGRYLLLWVLGIPLPILVLLWAFGGIH
jgi:hypothetical protein